MSLRWELPSRKRLSKLDKRADDSGEFAELLVAEGLGPTARHQPDETDWYDVVVRDVDGVGEAKVEVKSTHRTLQSGRPGRFRLWEDQTESLVYSDNRGLARYAFVLLDGTPQVTLSHPRLVRETVRGDGGWAETVHERGEREHRIPWDEVFRG